MRRQWWPEWVIARYLGWGDVVEDRIDERKSGVISHSLGVATCEITVLLCQSDLLAQCA